MNTNMTPEGISLNPVPGVAGSERKRENIDEMSNEIKHRPRENQRYRSFRPFHTMLQLLHLLIYLH